MPTLTILTNASQGSAVTIRDLGIIIPASGGSETFTDRRNIIKCSQSANLLTLATDDAHGANSSTLILNDGSGDIAQANVAGFLDALPAEYTASNIGVAGVGVFDSKSAGVLQFKNINAGSNQQSVTDDTGNNEIDLDIVGANLTSVPALAAVVSASTGSGAADITTSSVTDILMVSMSVVPGEAATYAVQVSGAGFMDANNRSFFVSLATGTVAEVTDVTTVADTAGSLGGTHFLITSPTRGYYVWFDVDNGSADPAVANRTGIEVDISANDTANTVAAALQTAMDAETDFSASVLTNVVTITNAFSGFVPDAANVDAGFTVNITTQGTATQIAGSERESEALDVLPWMTTITTAVTAVQAIQGTWRVDTGGGTIRASRAIVAIKIAAV